MIVLEDIIFYNKQYIQKFRIQIAIKYIVSYKSYSYDV